MKLLKKSLLGLAVSAISLSALSAPELKSVERSNWIESVYEGRSEGITLRDMTFPGTHDSGTHNITSSSDLHEGQNKIYAAAKGVVADWSKTVSDNCYDQLNAGIRYLDLRVREHDGDLILLHALVGMEFEDCLVQIKQFMDENPKEIVFLEAANTPGGSYNKTMFDLFDQYFGNRKPANNKPVSKLILDELWANDPSDGQRNTAVIMINGVQPTTSNRGFFDNDDLKGGYANTTSIRNMVVHIEGLLGNNNDDNLMMYTTYTLTPQTDDIVKDVLNVFASGSMKKWSDERLRPVIGNHMAYVESKNWKPNFIATDFHEYTSAVASAIRFNTVATRAPAGKLEYTLSDNVTRVWDDSGSGAHNDGSIWRVDALPGFYPLGDIPVNGYSFSSGVERVLVKGNQEGVVKPLGYTWMWNDTDSGADDDVSIWRAIPPKGYVCLGDVATLNHGFEPSTDLIRCVHESYVEAAQYSSWKWDDDDSGAKHDTSWYLGYNNNGRALNTGSLRAVRGYHAVSPYLFKSITRAKTQFVSADLSLDSFVKTSNAAISGYNNETLRNVTPQQCASACMNNSRKNWCVSFDYAKRSNSCDLSSKRASNIGGLKTNYSGNPYDHYSLK